jgi:Xaa-Pro aminopeptidase
MDDRGERRNVVQRRLARFREVLDRRDGRAALLGTRRNFAWLTAGGLSHIVLASEAGVASLLVTRDEVVVVAPNIEARRLADEELAGLDIEVVPVPWWDEDALQAEAERRAGGTVLDDDDLEEELVPVRATLDALDQERLAELGGRTAAAFDTAVGSVRRGQTEEQVVAELGSILAAQGIRAPVLLAAADERIERYRHPLPTRAPIERRVMLVVVAERHGLHVAATRFVELEEPEAELRRRVEAVAEVQAALRAASRPGRTLGDAFVDAQAAYARVGFPDEWQLHHQGGLIGYQGRERVAVPGDATVTESGMAFAWNPSITGTKVEETFLVAEDGSPVPILA